MIWHLLMEAGGGTGGEGSGGPPSQIGTLIMFALVGIVFYTLLLRPQKKKERERKEMLGRIQKKDAVQTIGGIHGQIVELTEDTVVLRVDKNKDIKIKFSRTAIAGLVESADAEGTETN